jgi:hypothetical protein
MNLTVLRHGCRERLPAPQQLSSGVRDDLSAVVLDPNCRSAGLGSQGGQEAASARKPGSRHRCGGANYPAGRATKVDGVGRRSLTPRRWTGSWYAGRASCPLRARCLGKVRCFADIMWVIFVKWIMDGSGIGGLRLPGRG